MADVESALVTILASNTEVAALASDRIFPLTRGNCNSYPALVYMRISSQPWHTHDQAGGLITARFQIDSFGRTFSSTRQMANAVTAALSGWNDWAGGVFLNALQVDERDLFENETGIYRISQDYMVTYR